MLYKFPCNAAAQEQPSPERPNSLYIASLHLAPHDVLDTPAALLFFVVAFLTFRLACKRCTSNTARERLFLRVACLYLSTVASASTIDTRLRSCTRCTHSERNASQDVAFARRR